jgi:hypothetical protein
MQVLLQATMLMTVTVYIVTGELISPLIAEEYQGQSSWKSLL